MVEDGVLTLKDEETMEKAVLSCILDAVLCSLVVVVVCVM